jgi:hypothetical protein
MDIPTNRTATAYVSARVEFVCPSVTSDGFYELVRASLPAGTPIPTAVATTHGVTGAVAAANLTPVPTADRPDPRVDPPVEPIYASSWPTVSGSRRISPAAVPMGDRSDEPHDGPRTHR